MPAFPGFLSLGMFVAEISESLYWLHLNQNPITKYARTHPIHNNLDAPRFISRCEVMCKGIPVLLEYFPSGVGAFLILVGTTDI